MSEPEFRLTRSQLDRLGQRLRSGEEPSDDDLELLTRYQLSLQPLLQAALDYSARAFRGVLPDAPFSPTIREKQLRSIIAKLQRQSTRLSAIQDIVGFRIVVPTALTQQAVVERMPMGDTWQVIDRRERPSHDYRAVHIVHRGHIGAVEVQVRSLLQHRWADLSERLDRVFPGTKYGEGPPEVRTMLHRVSEMIASLEAAELDRDALLPRELDAVRQSVIDLLDRMIQDASEETDR